MLVHHLYGKLQVRHCPGGVLDVAVRIERREADHLAPVKLIGIGLPEQIRNQTVVIPAGEQKGYLSFPASAHASCRAIHDRCPGRDHRARRLADKKMSENRRGASATRSPSTLKAGGLPLV